MAIVKCPRPVNTVKYGVEWKDGIAEVNNTGLVGRLLAKGYTLVETKAEKPKTEKSTKKTVKK